MNNIQKGERINRFLGNPPPPVPPAPLASRDTAFQKPTKKRRIPNALAKLRKQLHYRAADLAKQVGCDRADISKYEQGWTMPTLCRAFDLASALSTNVEQLYPEMALLRKEQVNARREGINQEPDVQNSPRRLLQGRRVQFVQ